MTPPHSPLRILLVEDDQPLRDRLARALRERGYAVVTAHDRTTARTAAAEPVDAALIDLRLGADDGRDVANDVRERYPKARVAIATGSTTAARDPALLRAVNAGVIVKPFDLDEVLAHLGGQA